MKDQKHQEDIKIFHDIAEFLSALGSRGVMIGIDYGLRKIGVAISDPARQISMPLYQLSISGVDNQLEKLMQITKEQNPAGIIIGLPVNMDGSYSDQTQAVEDFAKKLGSRISLPVFMQDERLTSKASSALLKNIGLDRRRREQKEDSVAASLILDSALQRLKNS